MLNQTHNQTYLAGFEVPFITVNSQQCNLNVAENDVCWLLYASTRQINACCKHIQNQPIAFNNLIINAKSNTQSDISCRFWSSFHFYFSDSILENRTNFNTFAPKTSGGWFYWLVLYVLATFIDLSSRCI
jgi:hypothetical protein